MFNNEQNVEVCDAETSSAQASQKFHSTNTARLIKDISKKMRSL